MGELAEVAKIGLPYRQVRSGCLILPLGLRCRCRGCCGLCGRRTCRAGLLLRGCAFGCFFLVLFWQRFRAKPVRPTRGDDVVSSFVLAALASEPMRGQYGKIHKVDGICSAQIGLAALLNGAVGQPEIGEACDIFKVEMSVAVYVACCAF